MSKINEYLKTMLNRVLTEQKGLVGSRGRSMFNSGAVKHDANLESYRKYYERDVVGLSIDALSEMTVGNGIFNTVEDESDPKQKAALNEINKLCEKIRLDERLFNIDVSINVFGFAPVERIVRRGPPGGLSGLLCLDPPSVKYKITKHGEFMEFQQIISGAVNEILKFKPEEIIWFTNGNAGNNADYGYGVSMIKRVLPLLAIRDTVVENINGIMKNQAVPPTLWKVKNQNDSETLRALLNEAHNQGEDLILYPGDNVEHDIIKLDTRAHYWEYVEYIDALIFQGLNSPMLNYIGNANLASSDNIMNAIQRHVEGRQRYLKRMIEHEVYKFHLERKGLSTDVIPTLNFGVPKTGLEDVNIADLISKGLDLQYINVEQFHAIIKSLGLTLPAITDKQLSLSGDGVNGNVNGNVKLKTLKGDDEGGVEYRIRRVDSKRR